MQQFSDIKETVVKISNIVGLVLLLALFLGAGARPASALICCSVCFENPHNPACRAGCSQSCAIESEPVETDTVIEDDAAQVCYAVTADDEATEPPRMKARSCHRKDRLDVEHRPEWSQAATEGDRLLGVTQSRTSTHARAPDAGQIAAGPRP